MIEIRRLTPGDVAVARRLFTLMSTVFGDEASPIGDAYLARLLERQDFWAIAASIEGELVGGLTAHTLPMTRSESSEIFIYDIAVREACQRRGIGRTLMTAVREMAAAEGIHELFVPADNEDTHALAFYRALGGAGSAVTIFDFPSGSGAPDAPR